MKPFCSASDEFSTITIVAVLLFAASLASAQAAAPSRNPASGASALETASREADNVPLGGPFQWSLPKYPKQAVKSRIQGMVVLAVSVDEEGYVSNASAISGDPQLAESALGAARKWKYVPYDLNGRPVAATTKVELDFRIAQSGTPKVSATFTHPPRPDIGPLFRVVDGVTPPKPVYSPRPLYSKQAKKDKYQGYCFLSLVVGPDGKPYDVKVSRSIGEDLDEKAIEAVRNWRFEPGLKDGRPVAVAVDVEIKFVLD